MTTRPLPFDPEDIAEAGAPNGEASGPARAKSAQAFRTISEVSEELDIPAHVLRFWETKFPQLTPMKRGGGRRYYRPTDMAMLRGIRALLYDEGLTIKGLQKMFRERGARAIVAIGEGGDAALVAEEPSTAITAACAEPASSLAGAILRLEKLRDRLRATI